MTSFQFTLKHPMTPQQFRAIMDDERFIDTRFDIYKAEKVSLDLRKKGDITYMTAVAKPGTQFMPSAVRAFIPKDATLTFEEKWMPMQGTTCQGTATLTITGVPVKITLSQIIEQYADQCVRYIEGDTLIENDLLGIVSRNVQRHLDKLVRYEEQTMIAYMDRYGLPQC